MLKNKKHLAFLAVMFAFIAVGWTMIANSVPDQVPSKAAADAASQEVMLADGASYDLVASEVRHTIGGKTYDMMAYNGSVPGPTIRVKQGATITINFKNELPTKTLLHSHGVRMDSMFDGSQVVQKEMEPGETFAYQLRFPDPGIYWYHPHVRDDIGQPLGLYGVFIVEPSDPAYWGPSHHDNILALGDILIEDGEIAPYSQDFVTHALMGRFGNTMVVNGKAEEEFHGEPGEVHRFFIVNVASTRTFNFAIPGARMKLVGSDGGRYETERFVNSVVIAPSERMIVDVSYPKAGTYQMEHATPEKVYPLGTIAIDGTPVADATSAGFDTIRSGDAVSDEYATLRGRYLGKDPDKRLRLTLETDMTTIMSRMMGSGAQGAHDHGGMMGNAAPIEWEDDMSAMNVYSTSRDTRWIIKDEDTGKENMDVQWTFKTGDYVKVRITNDKDSMHPMQHPIHFHGNRFLVLATNGTENTNLVWKDTELVKTGDVVDILVEMSNPGKWMAHCHILEHLHTGMMIGYEVK